MNSGETVELRKLAVSLQGPWPVDWNLLIRNGDGSVLTCSLEQNSTDSETPVNPSLTPTPIS